MHLQNMIRTCLPIDTSGILSCRILCTCHQLQSNLLGICILHLQRIQHNLCSHHMSCISFLTHKINNQKCCNLCTCDRKMKNYLCIDRSNWLLGFLRTLLCHRIFYNYFLKYRTCRQRKDHKVCTSFKKGSKNQCRKGKLIGFNKWSSWKCTWSKGNRCCLGVCNCC